MFPGSESLHWKIRWYTTRQLHRRGTLANHNTHGNRETQGPHVTSVPGNTEPSPNRDSENSAPRPDAVGSGHNVANRVPSTIPRLSASPFSPWQGEKVADRPDEGARARDLTLPIPDHVQFMHVAESQTRSKLPWQPDVDCPFTTSSPGSVSNIGTEIPSHFRVVSVRENRGELQLASGVHLYHFGGKLDFRRNC